MIKILAQVSQEIEMPEEGDPIELLVPVLPRKGDYFRIKEGGKLGGHHVVSDVVFFQDDGKNCSVCVILKKPSF